MREASEGIRAEAAAVADAPRPVRVGVIGCGAISGVYLKLAKTFPILDVVACADLLPERAEARAREFGVARAGSVAEVLADPEVEVILNLTVPRAHGEVALAALEAGKSVYNEKPLAIERAEARRVLQLARATGLLVGCAPDTFLGAGLQTCRKLIDDGWIGEPVAASASLQYRGPETFHPDPRFYYQPGGGPMFDMGPYYLTALVALLGPVRRVAGLTRTTFAERTITSQPLFGRRIPVETPTHVAGLLEFASGVVATIVTSFDVWATAQPPIEIHGALASLRAPDPNTFGGPVLIRRGGAPDWLPVPLTHGYAENSRGLGLADLAYALRSGRPHRADGELAYHVLDAMHAFDESSRAGAHVAIASECRRPAPLPLGLPPGRLDP